jgi:hypothetical protein
MVLHHRPPGRHNGSSCLPKILSRSPLSNPMLPMFTEPHNQTNVKIGNLLLSVRQSETHSSAHPGRRTKRTLIWVILPPYRRRLAGPQHAKSAKPPFCQPLRRSVATWLRRFRPQPNELPRTAGVSPTPAKRKCKSNSPAQCLPFVASSLRRSVASSPTKRTSTWVICRERTQTNPHPICSLNQCAATSYAIRHPFHPNHFLAKRTHCTRHRRAKSAIVIQTNSPLSRSWHPLA